eukprot:gene7566-1353_t
MALPGAPSPKVSRRSMKSLWLVAIRPRGGTPYTVRCAGPAARPDLRYLQDLGPHPLLPKSISMDSLELFGAVPPTQSPIPDSPGSMHTTCPHRSHPAHRNMVAVLHAVQGQIARSIDDEAAGLCADIAALARRFHSRQICIDEFVFLQMEVCKQWQHLIPPGPTQKLPQLPQQHQAAAWREWPHLLHVATKPSPSLVSEPQAAPAAPPTAPAPSRHTASGFAAAPSVSCQSAGPQGGAVYNIAPTDQPLANHFGVPGLTMSLPAGQPSVSSQTSTPNNSEPPSPVSDIDPSVLALSLRRSRTGPDEPLKTTLDSASTSPGPDPAEPSDSVKNPDAMLNLKVDHKLGLLGYIKWFNVKQGYGFIKAFNMNLEAFFHHSTILSNVCCGVNDGAMVWFDVQPAQQSGLQATAVVPLEPFRLRSGKGRPNKCVISLLVSLDWLECHAIDALSQDPVH